MGSVSSLGSGLAQCCGTVISTPNVCAVRAAREDATVRDGAASRHRPMLRPLVGQRLQRRAARLRVEVNASQTRHIAGSADGKLLRLEAGDSFSFTRKRPHRCHTPGAVPAVVLWVITPPSY
jgi:hypothetical protein